MTDDRALLEAAAKAAGMEIESTEIEAGPYYDGLRLRGSQIVWNPLEDDGDALRLAVKLGIDPSRCFQIIIDGEIARTGVRHTERGGKYDELEEHASDPYAATRRAIVRAAASLSRGERMEG